MRGCTKSIGGGLGVGRRGQIEASSSGMNVDTDGDVFKDSGISTPNKAGSVDIPKLFIISRFKLSGISILPPRTFSIISPLSYVTGVVVPDIFLATRHTSIFAAIRYETLH